MDRIWFVALALLVAGCAAPQDPADPGTDDPATSGPSDPGTDDPATSGPSDPGNDGQDTRPRDGEEPPGFAPQGHHKETEGRTLNTLYLEGTMDTCDAGFCIEATATNQGTEALYIHDPAVCRPSWSEGMHNESGPVQHHEPIPVCQAFALKELAPGQSVHYNTTWDKQLWHDGEATPAPDGAYTWQVHFEGFASQDGEGHETLTLEFPAIIGET